MTGSLSPQRLHAVPIIHLIRIITRPSLTASSSLISPPRLPKRTCWILIHNPALWFELWYKCFFSHAHHTSHAHVLMYLSFASLSFFLLIRDLVLVSTSSTLSMYLVQLCIPCWSRSSCSHYFICFAVVVSYIMRYLSCTYIVEKIKTSFDVTIYLFVNACIPSVWMIHLLIFLWSWVEFWTTFHEKQINLNIVTLFLITIYVLWGWTMLSVSVSLGCCICCRMMLDYI